MSCMTIVLNGMVQKERERRERNGGRGRWVDLGCLMTPGFSKDIRCHLLPYCSKRYGAEREGEEREREGAGRGWRGGGPILIV